MHKQWPIKMVPQETPAKCWAAAAAMLMRKRSPVGPGGAKTSPDGGLLPDRANVGKFARHYGLVLEPMMSRTAEGLWHLFQRGPLMVMGNVKIPRTGVGGHAFVISAMEFEGPNRPTYLTIYDPKPAILLRVNYETRMREYPLGMYYVFRNAF